MLPCIAAAVTITSTGLHRQDGSTEPAQGRKADLQHDNFSLSAAGKRFWVRAKANIQQRKAQCRDHVCLQALGSVAFAYSFSFILLEITVSPTLACCICDAKL